MIRSRSITAAISLVVVGIILLIGCIPIPATRQFQPNGKPRPEWAIGKNRAIRVGETKIEDAIIELSRRVQSEPDFQTWSQMFVEHTQSGHPWPIMRWRVSENSRQYAIGYSVRTWTWF